MKRKLLAILLIVCLVISIAPAALAAGYDDTDGHWAEGSIERWAAHGIIEGYDGKFDPDGTMTRAQAAAIFARLLKLDAKADISKYTDVDSDAWYAEYIAMCVAAGIMNGVGDNAMDPNGTLTREQMMVMLCRALGIQPEATCDKTFADSDKISDWAEGYINALVNAGIVDGVGNNTMAPATDINRASMMALLDKSIAGYADEDGETLTVEEGKTGIILVVADNVKVEDAPAGTIVVTGADAHDTTVNGTEITNGTVHEVPEEEPKPSTPVVPSYPVIPPHSHTYGDWAPNYDGTHTRYYNCGHTGSEKANCTFVADVCSVCGYDKNAIYIDTAAELKAFRDNINDGTFAGGTVVLTADIDLAGEEWAPIGTAEHPFSGTFDGNGKTISNLKITTGNYAGLFGYVSTATIKNVKLANADVSGGERMATLIGKITGNATVTNCSNDADSSVTGSDSNTGGLIGEIVNGTVALTNLVNNAAVENTKSSNSRAGGVVAQVTTGANVTLTNCTNNGAVKTNNGYAGGIVSAYQSGTMNIKNCVNNNNGNLVGAYKGNMLGWYTSIRSITISSDTNEFDINAIGRIDIDISSDMSLYGKHYFVNKKADLTGVSDTAQTFSEVFAEGEIGTSPKALWDKLIAFYAFAAETNSNFAGYPDTYWSMFNQLTGYSEPDWDTYFNSYNAKCEAEGRTADKLTKEEFNHATWREKIVYLAP